MSAKRFKVNFAAPSAVDRQAALAAWTGMAQAHRRWIARPGRLLGGLLVALALSPGLLWRSASEPIDGPQPVEISDLKLPGAVLLAPGLTLAGGWQVKSRSNLFGGYSALLATSRGRLLALSDRGYFLQFGQPGAAASPVAMGKVGGANDSDKRRYDIESATRDPSGQHLWLGYEGRNAIVRFDPALKESREVRPEPMREWPSNRGAEALVRLADGRFLVLSEALDGGHPAAAQGLLFAGDPIAHDAPEAQFRFVPPDGFRPTDMAQLPDGRVVVLLRRIDFLPWPRLTSRLVVADPATIAPGASWRWRPLAEIRPPLPPENYEGLAIEPRAGGTVRLWLISDDNGSVIQRTLLLALDWDPRSGLRQP